MLIQKLYSLVQKPFQYYYIYVYIRTINFEYFLIAYNTTRAMMVSIFVFAVGFGRFFNKNCGSRSVSVFMVVYKQNTICNRLPDAPMQMKNNVHSNSITRPNDRTRHARRDDAISIGHCLECASPKWMNLRTWIAWEIWDHRMTDQPAAYPAAHRGQVCKWVDWEVDLSTAQVKSNFDKFHNQWLMHWHSNQVADLFNSRNIIRLNH